MMKLPLCSISCFFCCIIVSSFLLNTLVSLPFPRPDQVDILLAFKSEFSSTNCDVPNPAIKSWTKDTTTFDGVVFDNETGVVTELHLGLGCLSGTLKANSSLFRFQHLRYLDLSFNDFSSSPFLADFGRLTNLEVLDLGYNGLVGEISSSINNLSRLTRLDLSVNEFIGTIPFIYNLTKLSFLDLSVNHFSGTVPSSLFTMHFLTSLNLRQNHLKDPLKTVNSSSSSKLKKLFLTKNLFNGGILEPISKLVSLTHIDLSFNDFSSSSFPSEFGKLVKLEFLDLHSNSFIGEVPSSISNLSHLTDLDLSNNKFTGIFPSVHHLTKLSTLNLSSNHFSGPIPSSLLTMPSSLSILDLSGNHLNDPLQYMNSSSSSSKLQELHLGYNLFSDQILEPILKLVNLIDLDLSFLNITYPVNFYFSPLKSLEVLDISGNNISWPSSIRYDALSTNLIELSLSSCNINDFPMFLKKLQKLEELDISNNNIKGKVPEWLWNMPFLTDLSLSHNSFDSFEGSKEFMLSSSVRSLELDSNSFKGYFPSLPPSVMYLSAPNNNFGGEIPLSLCNASSLRLLDLSNNNFSGSIPRCFKDALEVLNLHNNSLNGRISDSFNKGYPLLTTIDVGHNQLIGKLPRSLVNCTSLETLNVESNGITDTFPFWLMTLLNLQVIVLRSNKFHGPISSPQDPLSFPRLRIIDISRNNFNGTLPADYFMNWSAALVNMSEVYRLPEYMTNQFVGGYQPSIYLREKGLSMKLEKIPLTYTVVDFSGNRLRGTIPESIGLLKQLVVLDLSNNGLIGHIPPSLGKLTKLESLDLSRNQLFGEIPQELTTLSFLGYINVSHNKLRGQIPQCTQFGGQPQSSFEENVDLCGLPLQKSCFEENVSSPTPNSKSREKEQLFNWKATAIGYGFGVLIGLVIGQVLASYKPALYYKLFRL